ncbi:Hpt domain-containing protein [Methylotenera mobilis]|uniref:Chemotaxis protein CheA n=1 Tax=Methylotenera mobilis (strain JLW8 / ATCC BAA-1282 / DSM 17540) TaxID=583345 RepID=C6WW97_METML|nr:Hpt domain-containing protein [Methylotenera mobilis]ACT48196.1 CheA signal transduction histidine kinase [Methylotenera mobilis JLW8]
MPEAFDTGPLSWVKDEIDQSLQKVLESFNEVNQNPSEFANLRFTIAHLYQVSGALDMVGLEGCKRYCNELEKLADSLAKQQIAVSQELMEHLIGAVEALSKYLQDLLNGQPDQPIRLYKALKPIVEAQGETLDESELFFPDVDNSAPKDLPSNPIEESSIPIFVSEQRAAFQKSLLDWLRTKDAVALEGMRVAVAQVQQVQSKSAPRTLWWAASAFTDALAQQKLADNPGAKKLCSKLDRQLRNVAMGDAKVPSRLLRDLLYYVAISDRSTDTISAVKNTFELDAALPSAAQVVEAASSSAAEQAALAQLIADIPTLKDLWANISVNDALTSALDLATLVNKFEHILNTVQQGINHEGVVNLFNVSYQTVQDLQNDAAKLNDVAFIEIAASLNLLESSCDHYQQLDAEANQKINTQISRLQAVMRGETLAPAVDAFAQAQHDATLVEAVAKQVLAALAIVEKALDSFFRNPENTNELEEASKPLQQIAAAFDMLEMPVPTSIAQLSANFVEHFKDHDSTGHLSIFELIAENLSMLGLYAEELPHVHTEAERALADALLRLEDAAAMLGLAPAGLVQAESTASELASSAPDRIEDVLPIDLSAIDLNLGDANDIAEAQAKTPAVPDAGEALDQAFDPELLDIFLAEAEEVLATLAQNLQALRVNATDSEAFVEVRRSYHTLKGSGRTVGLVTMGEVAWAVEHLLNVVLDRKTFPTPAILAFVEKVSAAFANWIAELQQAQKVSLNPTPFQQQASALINELEQNLATVQPTVQKEEVLIGGTRKLSKAFFNIFLGEAQQHLLALQEAHAALVVDSTDLPTAESCRAAHTLGSNALTAGFKAIGELARALEHWLDEHHSTWTEQHIALYGNVVKALADGLEKAKALKNPRSSRALILALGESTAAMQASAAKEAEAAVLEIERAEKSKKKSKSKVKAAAEPAETELAPTAMVEPDLIQAATTQVEPLTELSGESSVELAQLPVETDVLLAAEQALQRKDAIVNDELLALFVEEARELIPQIGKDLRGWRINPKEAEYPDSLQRALHTLKGSARMAGQAAIGDSVHGMEDHVIRALRHQVTMDDFDAMFVEFDRIGYMLEDVVGDMSSAVVSDTPAQAKVKAATPKSTRQSERKTQFLRMRADVLDRLINEAGEVSIMRSRMDREMQNFKQSSTDLTDSISRLRTYLRELEIEAETQLQSRMSLLQEANETFDPLEFDRFTRLQELTRMMAESVNDVATIQHGLLLNLDQTDAALQQQNRMNRELQQGLMTVRMLPFSTISERLQRIVRQTARELNKRVEMTIEGENIELDRGVLDKMGAPLEHLLRNAVAHGLESASERVKLGKSEVGHIKLKVSLENDEITLVITDDGAGVNLAKVKQKAVEKGLFGADQEVSDQALMTIIFEPGFSTADSVSQIAGRGVGLDAVRSDIAALGGRIDVSNASGLGAMFNIYLPVTLSVAQVVLARVGTQTYAIPSVMVEQVQKLKSLNLSDAYNAGKVSWAGREYPLHFLSKLVGDVDHIAQAHTYTPVVLLRSGAYRTALHVDELIGNQEVVMKPMGTQLSHVPGMIGATVMGDGAIILVINPVLLANREELSSGAIKVTNVAPIVEKLKKVALVVDDSLTMRKVLSRVLERDGFEVVTANDGMDAIQKLQQISPAIILSDIEMPRMDGFEFSRYVRDNAQTSHTPLIIISSRTAEKHRNVAAEIGVNAFLGKPVQDEVLIEQVHALLNH